MELKDKIDKAMWHCYIELYKNAEPPADFIELVSNAETNERGQKVIDFMAYKIEDSKMDEIIEATISKFRLIGIQRSVFKSTVYLGCSPRGKNSINQQNE